MAKTPTERVRDFRRRHPEKARAYYAASNKKRKERKEAETKRKRETMAAIMARAKLEAK